MTTTERRGADWVLGAAVLVTGLLAGFFSAWVISVMPGLADVDDRTFVAANQQMIRAVNESPVFFLIFLGAPALTIWTSISAARAGARRAVRWHVASLVLYGVCFLITVAVHVPLNDALEKAGDPAAIRDLAGLVDAFEGPWVTWHVIRTLALVGSFVALVCAVLTRARSAEARHVSRSRAGDR